MATVRYFVTDVDASIEFYETLGFKLKDRPGPPFASMTRDDLELWVSGPGTSAMKPMPDGAKPGPGGWNRFAIVVDDIEATVSALKSHGAVFRNEILEGPGGKQILLEDPSGNPIELFQPRGA